MFISSEAVIQNLIVHQIKDDNLLLSDDFNPLNGQHAKSLMKFLFRPFIKDERFHFTNLDGNEFFNQVAGIFNNPEQFIPSTQEIANRLFRLMGDDTKDGEIIACLFEDCVMDDEVTDAVGLFFLDNKQDFLKIENENYAPQITFSKGQSKIQKGIMIFNTDAEHGYQALVINKGKGGNPDPFWSAFVSVEKIKDNYFQTQNFIQNIQEFAQTSFEQDEASEKIALVNESINYIKENDFFEKKDYQQQVLHSPELIEKFNQFTEEKSAESPNNPELDQFEISKPAVRTSKRFIRSVIKLDKNFHVYVHGNQDNIVKGFDEEKNKHFYTLFYEEEE